MFSIDIKCVCSQHRYFEVSTGTFSFWHPVSLFKMEKVNYCRDKDAVWLYRKCWGVSSLTLGSRCNDRIPVEAGWRSLSSYSSSVTRIGLGGIPIIVYLSYHRSNKSNILYLCFPISLKVSRHWHGPWVLASPTWRFLFVATTGTVYNQRLDISLSGLKRKLFLNHNGIYDFFSLSSAVPSAFVRVDQRGGRRAPFKCKWSFEWASVDGQSWNTKVGLRLGERGMGVRSSGVFKLYLCQSIDLVLCCFLFYFPPSASPSSPCPCTDSWILVLFTDRDFAIKLKPHSSLLFLLQGASCPAFRGGASWSAQCYIY